MNQCDGCARGLPITKLGFHHTENELFSCTRARYGLALEPVTYEAWSAEFNKARKDVPFTFGDKK